MRILSIAIIKASCIIFFTTSGAIPPLDLVNYQGDLQHCVTARMPTRYVKYWIPCGQQCLFFFQCSLQFYGYSKNLCGHQHQTKRQVIAFSRLRDFTSFVIKHKVNKPFGLKTKRRQKLRDPRAKGYRSSLELNFLAPWQRDVTL